MTHQIEVLNLVKKLLQTSNEAYNDFQSKHNSILQGGGEKFAIPIDRLREIDVFLFENTLMLQTLLTTMNSTNKSPQC